METMEVSILETLVDLLMVMVMGVAMEISMVDKVFHLELISPVVSEFQEVLVPLAIWELQAALEAQVALAHQDPLEVQVQRAQLVVVT